MIACCSGTKFPPIIYSPAERGEGVTQDMLLDYIRNLLAQAAGALTPIPSFYASIVQPSMARTRC